MSPLEHKALWGLRSDMHFLNHGSFGATPLVVQEEQSRIRARMEAQPIRYFVRHVPVELTHCAGLVAELVGAKAKNLSFVDNATAGVNAVLRSLPVGEGDRMVTLSHVYPAVRNAMQALAAQTGASVVEVRLPCPVLDDDWLNALDQALLGARLAVLDHVTSATGLVLPIQAMIALCRKHGVPVLVDGAHAPGLLPLQIEALGADWYTGNLHKWVCAPKGSAFLWAAPKHQANLQPPVIGHAYGQNWQQAFHTLGTRDYSNWLSIPAVLDFWSGIGGLDQARAHNNGLALEAEILLREGLGAQVAGPVEMRAAMVALLLPESAGVASKQGSLELNDRLWQAHRIEVPITPHEGRLWLRISAQLYNDLADYRALLSALQAIQVE